MGSFPESGPKNPATPGARRYRPHFVLIWLLAALLLGTICANLLLCRNTLRENGAWTSTKTTLEKGVNGAIAFVDGPQALARGRLNLGAWGGFQETIFNRAAVYKRVVFDFTLSPGAYLNVFLARAGGDVSACARTGARLSADPAFPGLVYTASKQGEFLVKTPVADGTVSPDVRHEAVLAFQAGEAELSLDGRPIGRTPFDGATPFTVGFRGGLHPAFVENVRLIDEKGGSLREHFLNVRLAARVLPLTAAALILANVLIFAAARRSRIRLAMTGKDVQTGELLFSCALAYALPLFVGLCLLAWQYLAAPDYQVVAERERLEENYWKESKAHEILSSIKTKYAPTPPPGAVRILLLGSSQTWGAGASTPQASFAEVLERLLNDASPARRFECIDAAVSGESSLEISGRIETLLELAPQVVIINLSNNDKPGPAFTANLEKIVGSCLERRVTPLLALEANSPEGDNPSLLANHEAMRALAAHYGLAVLDVPERLRDRADDGFCWWDFVHPTDFGHRLIAQAIFEAAWPILEPLGRYDLKRQIDSAGSAGSAESG